jgi:glutathione peroxidase
MISRNLYERSENPTQICGWPDRSSSVTDIYDFSAETLDGRTMPLSEYRGRPLLIVNTASQCGFTPQYAGLQALHDAYAGRGFEVLGFSCNQFGAQEPGDAGEIAGFCQKNYGVTFPMFAKVDVNGEQAHPLFRYLRGRRRGILGTSRIKWNFTKFLIDKAGEPVARFAPSTKPETLRGRIEALL